MPVIDLDLGAIDDELFLDLRQPEPASAVRGAESLEDLGEASSPDAVDLGPCSPDSV
jgi:hypothetical protein